MGEAAPAGGGGGRGLGREVARCEGGCCISLQNGVDSAERLAPILGPDRLPPGLAFVSGVIERPGMIRYISPMSAIHYGEIYGSMSARATAFRDACTAAGFGAVVEPDIVAEQWNKFVALCTNAALTVLMRAPAGVICQDAALIEIARAAFGEVAAVERALGVKLAADVVEKSLQGHRNFPPSQHVRLDVPRPGARPAHGTGEPVRVRGAKGPGTRRPHARSLARLCQAAAVRQWYAGTAARNCSRLSAGAALRLYLFQYTDCL